MVVILPVRRPRSVTYMTRVDIPVDGFYVYLRIGLIWWMPVEWYYLLTMNITAIRKRLVAVPH